MNLVGLGDLAQSLQLRRDSARLQSSFRALSEELSSGKKADLGSRVSGEFGPLVGIERSLKAISAYETSVSEVRLMTQTAQSALAYLSDRVSGISPSLLLSGTNVDPILVDTAAETAARGFEDAVAALNVRVGDRSVFAGIATDTAALADPSEMLNELATLTAGETTAAGVTAVVEAWFGPGGGFETGSYLGAEATLSNIPVSQEEQVSLGVTALDDGIRDTLEGLALGALLARNGLVSEPSERVVLARMAGDRLLEAGYALTETRAGVGTAQERIEAASVRNATERQALELARAKITEIDPFETAARLSEVEVQLEALFTVTARMSRLNLATFL